MIDSIQLTTAGLRSGDTIMLHASVRSIGKEASSPIQVIKSLLDAIGPTGTLMMYVGCDPKFEAIGRGKLTKTQEEALLSSCPIFDPQITPARKDYGILAEYFRQLPGVVCSVNPGARIAAIGAKAKEITTDHALQYGYGTESPLARLCDLHGKVLLLGSDLDQVTLLHYAEHIAPISNKRIVRFKVPLKVDGVRTWVEMEEYDTSVGIKSWPERFFSRIVENYISECNVSSQQVGLAKSYLLDAENLVNYAVKIMIQEAEKLDRQF